MVISRKNQFTEYGMGVDEWVDNKRNIVYWNGPEHVMVLVGWDDNDGYFNDPYTGKRVKYNLRTFKDRWEKMGSRAVTLYDPESLIFNDIKQHWALDTILWSNKNKIVQGYQDGSFKPDDTVTEAEFLAMIFRMFPEVLRLLILIPLVMEFGVRFTIFMLMSITWNSMAIVQTG